MSQSYRSFNPHSNSYDRTLERWAISNENSQIGQVFKEYGAWLAPLWSALGADTSDSIELSDPKHPNHQEWLQQDPAHAKWVMDNRNKPDQGKRGLFANAVAFFLKLATPLIVIFGGILVVMFGARKQKTDKPISPGTNQPGQAPSTTTLSNQSSTNQPQAANRAAPAPTHPGPTSSTTLSGQLNSGQNQAEKNRGNTAVNNRKKTNTIKTVDASQANENKQKKQNAAKTVNLTPMSPTPNNPSATVAGIKSPSTPSKAPNLPDDDSPNRSMKA